jgi:glycosyltransferase involved in cell wall biosynthesis
VKLLVFAHTPPPFHGQSYMVKLMLDGFQREARGMEPNLRVFHVDAKLSSNLEAIGKFQLWKVFRLLAYCAHAYFHRFVNRTDIFYYVPAPGLRAAVYRDWIVMFFCRPVFKKIIFHWHAAGLAEWLETSAREWERKITHWLLDDADLSIVLSDFGQADAKRFSPRNIEIVANGIPDPCPGFETSVLPERQRRLRERAEGARTTYTVLFVGACTAAKGLFAALDGIALLNGRLRQRQSSIGVKFVVAGDFASKQERQQFQERVAQSDLNGALPTEPIVCYQGFVAGEEKSELFSRADCLCFPTRYSAEGQPVTILEALAFGMAIVATRWRSIPELLNRAEARMTDDQNSKAIASALEAMLTTNAAEINRRVFLERYQADGFIQRLIAALIGT